jgi:hypothetical protein
MQAQQLHGMTKIWEATPIAFLLWSLLPCRQDRAGRLAPYIPLDCSQLGNARSRVIWDNMLSSASLLSSPFSRVRTKLKSRLIRHRKSPHSLQKSKLKHCHSSRLESPSSWTLVLSFSGFFGFFANGYSSRYFFNYKVLRHV